MTMAQPISALLLLLHALSYTAHTVTASSVGIYQDADCKTTAFNVTTSNGYPDGECTDVSQQTSLTFQSFQFLSLDEGCARK